MRTTIRSTTLLILAGTFAATVMSAFIIFHAFLLPEFEKIERTQVHTNAVRAVKAIEHSVDSLQDLTRDWAWWDDTYAFVKDRNQAFLQSNLVPSTYTETNLQIVAFFTPKGQVIWGEGLADDDRSLVQIPWQLEAFMQQWAPKAAQDETGHLKGLLALGERIHMISIERIRTSDLSGPSRGWMLMSRLLDAAMLDRIAEQAQVNLSVSSPERVPRSEGATLTREGDLLKASTVVDDVLGRPVLGVSTTLPTRISETGYRTMYTLLGMLVVASFVLSGIAYRQFRVRVTDRIMNIRNQLATVAGDREGKRFIELRGNDEVTDLAQDMNTVIRELRAHETFQQELIDSMQVGVAMVSADTRTVVQVNRKATEMIGLAADDVLGVPCQKVICPQNNDDCPILDRGMSGEMRRCEIVTADGTRKHILKSVVPVTRHGATFLLESFVDITEQEKVRHELAESENLYRTIFMNTGTATILIDDDCTIVMANGEFCKLVEAPSEEVVVHSSRWMDFFHPDDAVWMLEYHNRRREDPNSAPRSYEARVLTSGGGIRNVELTVGMVPETSMSVASLLDITRRKAVENELAKKAYHDSVTNLPNRYYLMDELDRRIPEITGTKRVLGMFMLDIDEFKNINDTFGHAAGDTLLADVGSRLQQNLESGDLLVRLGGDEFGILSETELGRDGLSDKAVVLLDCFQTPFSVGGASIYLGASIGIAVAPEDGERTEDIVRSTDLAMYQSKQMGKNTFSFFTEALNQRSRDHLEIENALRHALDRDEMEVWYQPKVDVSDGTGRIIGMEGLVRWRRDGNLVPPGEFIPFAEKTGLIKSIDLFVMERACRDTLDWYRCTGIMRPVSINLSANHFMQEGLVEEVFGVLERTQLPPKLLTLEITETTLMKNFEAAASAMKQLTARGVVFSLDDFGTGYSSLYYLKRLPFSTLKIDRSFIWMLDSEDAEGRTFVRTIVTLARELGLNTVAEGVETPEQLKYLMAEGCNCIQGFLFSPPIPASEFSQKLDEDGFTLPQPEQ
ncbi:bifunctional diguanylate cyclase/phosphodiesterase [Desulfovibrio oxyclinae]|uniref:bifunctional diguanylate cyclase/phosphodiesterase n=1 Tax=Desulfovibrio oxyclinae TaxID=63560 RepID=UPI00037809C8|nr:EAL domain-containing protein [Desulfovibrio oxyclinae]